MSLNHVRKLHLIVREICHKEHRSHWSLISYTDKHPQSTQVGPHFISASRCHQLISHQIKHKAWLPALLAVPVRQVSTRRCVSPRAPLEWGRVSDWTRFTFRIRSPQWMWMRGWSIPEIKLLPISRHIHITFKGMLKDKIKWICVHLWT